MGTFSGDKCPGNGDEHGRHCADCGQFWTTDRGSICELCEKFWCDDYQALFVELDCPSLLDEEECQTQPDNCCPRCFISFEHLWCKKAECTCSCKLEVVTEQYKRHTERGSLTGQVDLVKGTEVWVVEFYSYKKEPRVHLVVKKTEDCEVVLKEHLFYPDDNAAYIKVQQLTTEQINAGFVTPNSKYGWDTNPGRFGKLEDIVLTTPQIIN